MLLLSYERIVPIPTTDAINISKSLIEKKKSLSIVEEVAMQGGSMDFFLQLKSKVNKLL